MTISDGESGRVPKCTADQVELEADAECPVTISDGESGRVSKSTADQVELQAEVVNGIRDEAFRRGRKVKYINPGMFDTW